VALAGRTVRLFLAIGAVLCASPATTHAQSWEMIDDAAGATGEKVHSITSDSAGNIFTAGTMVDATGRYHAVIMKSSDSGATWSTVVDYPGVDDPPPVPPGNAIATGFHTIVSADVAGGESHLVAAGIDRRAPRPGTLSYTPQWVIIRSRDGGTLSFLHYGGPTAGHRPARVAARNEGRPGNPFRYDAQGPTGRDHPPQ
jgi:hypothetical protein